MKALFDGPQVASLIIAVLVLGLASFGMVWVGRMIRGEIGSGVARRGDPMDLAALEQIPPAMMKEAIARGLVVPSQLAAMTPMERTFLFASLTQKLAPPEPAPAPAPKPHAAALPADVPPAMLAILNAEQFRAWCPMCGAELQLPTFPPLLARCNTCGMKSAIRAEEGGRYVVNVSPPPKIS